MKFLDLDMDYFMDKVAFRISEDSESRLLEEQYGNYVWSRERVIDFFENNLGLSKNKKNRGRIVIGHNQTVFFWSELIKQGQLNIPFEVIHIDSHADLGLGYSSWEYILDTLLLFPVEERQNNSSYIDAFDKRVKEGIGDYLLFAIAYRWISRLTYCANPYKTNSDYVIDILKNFHEKMVWEKPVENTIQLAYNTNMKRPEYYDSIEIKEQYFETACKEPEVPFKIIPTIADVKYDGDFDFVVMAQSPNYTPESADFIMEIFREYIDEI